MIDRIYDLFVSIKEGIKLIFDREIPFSYKLIPFFGVLYVIYPFDFITDILPVIGQMDDIAIFGGALALFIKLAKKHKSKK